MKKGDFVRGMFSLYFYEILHVYSDSISRIEIIARVANDLNSLPSLTNVTSFNDSTIYYYPCTKEETHNIKLVLADNYREKQCS